MNSNGRPINGVYILCNNLNIRIMKYKKGDKVKVFSNVNLRSFDKGEEVTVKIVDPLQDIILNYYVENESGIGMWAHESELE